MVIEAGELAKQKELGIAAGTQRRHQRSYNETIKRLQDGVIGDIVEARSYWNGGVIWVIDREPGWSDMEWQLRNWNYFTWLGGRSHRRAACAQPGHHQLGVGRASGPGDCAGWSAGRGGKEHGHIYDHFAVEFEYPNGVRMFSQCRQINGCDNKVEEAVLGTKGFSNCQNTIVVRGGQSYRFREQDVNAYEQEHLDLINSIRAGQPHERSPGLRREHAHGHPGPRIRL